MSNAAIFDEPLYVLPELTGVGRALRRAFDAEVSQLGLTLPRSRVLMLLSNRDGRTGQSELTTLMEVEHPTAVRIIDGLETAGLVRRVPVPGDRRAKAIELTAEGVAVAGKVADIARKLNRHATAGISPGQLVLAREILGTLTDNLDRFHSRGPQRDQ